MSSTSAGAGFHRAERRFGLTLAVGMTVAGAVSLWLGHTLASRILWSVAALHLLGALLAPRLLKPSRIVLEWVVRIIGQTIALAVLSAFYYLIFTPFGLLWRALGKDGLRPHPPRWREVADRDNDPETLRRLY